MGHIFISYSRSDTNVIDKLADMLSATGLEVWLDRDDIRGGAKWRRQIVDAIKGADVFLLALSPNSVKSDNVLTELTIAEDEKKRILPVEIQPITVPEDFVYSLAGIQKIDLARDFSLGVECLLDVLREAKKSRSDIYGKVQRKAASILHDTTFPVEERIQSFIKAFVVESDNYHKISLEEIKAQDDRTRQLEENSDSVRNQLIALSKERKELLDKGLQPNSRAMQLVDKEVCELEQKLDLIRREYMELAKKQRSQLSEDLEELEKSRKEAAEISRKTVDKAEQLINRVFGEKPTK